MDIWGTKYTFLVSISKISEGIDIGVKPNIFYISLKFKFM